MYGYLFVYFTGESNPDGEQIYFSLSRDGLHWEDLHKRQPVLRSVIGEKGVRDPYILRSKSGDRFYILATDLSIYHRGGWEQTEAMLTGSRSLIIWESSNLIDWSVAQKVDVAPQAAGCAWAPEAIYDDLVDAYLVFWASSMEASDGKGRGMHIYCSTTKDFKSFSPAERYITRGANESIIDTTIIQVGNKYYRASGDGQITIESSEQLRGDWKKVSTLQSLGLELTGKDVEGPVFFKFNDQKRWVLLVDQYATSGGYLPIVTTDIGDTSGACWEKLKAEDYSFDILKKRHGSVLPITQHEYDFLLAHWGN
ncbi:glycoside hydrolase family 43 protein [Paenibacillus sp. 7523-1]|uniref:glycoside hydrolase family 43 protein n=2 Tax=unclassified Paenibacillus TaxID=185978 RepID=UPI000BA687D3|nr:glycoside hydrolase family 43 protein [Paenibacillus sp. 7523-1]PAD32903.1 hypothetical protein CHH60_02115 [Paenibacillus sp. 7523-1]